MNTKLPNKAKTRLNFFLQTFQGFETSQRLKDQLQTIRTILGTAPGEPVQAGVGFLGWILDNSEGSDDPRLPVVLAEKPAALFFAFGDDLGKYVAQVRAFDATREHKTIIFVTVNSVAEALRATNEWKVDVLVVQGKKKMKMPLWTLLMQIITGGEAGGHGKKTAPPLLTFLQAVLVAIPKESRPVVVGAGAISSGAQIAALLTLGADGALVGSRFLVSPECKYTAAQKQVILDADFNSTSRDRAFDEVNRTDYWPLGIEGRAVANEILTDVREGEDLETRLKRHEEGLAKEEKDRLVIWAGVGIGHLKEIKPAAVRFL